MLSASQRSAREEKQTDRKGYENCTQKACTSKAKKLLWFTRYWFICFCAFLIVSQIIGRSLTWRFFAEGFRRIVNSDRAKVRSKINDIKGRSLCETFGVATNLAVSFEECYGATESIEWLSIPHGRKRDITCEWDYEKMFKLMMQTKIGCEQMIDYASCFDDLTKILSEFHRKHEKFEYRYKLQHIMNLKKLGQSQKIQPVTLHQFQKYFNQIFFEVVPLSLFGKHRNVKKVRKALKQYFIVAFNDKISLTTCVHSFDVSNKFPREFIGDIFTSHHHSLLTINWHWIFIFTSTTVTFSVSIIFVRYHILK